MSSWTQADLDAIDATIKSCTLKVTYAGGNSVEYRSASELLTIRSMVAAAVAAPVSRSTLAQFSRGS